MKLTKTILLCTAFATTSLFVSCDDKKDAGSGDSGGAAAVVDTPDTLTDEIIVQMNALADAMVSAKDTDSAEAAVTKIEGISDKLDDIAARMDKLETPSEEKKKALDEKMDKATEGMQEKVGGAMTTVMGNPDVAKILGPAMQKFGERMKENDKIFERFGKKK